MATYRISGIWKNSDDVITHYAFHTFYKESNTADRAVKKSKTDAIALLEKTGNSAKTWVWNYSTKGWKDGEDVHVVDGQDGKYLRSDPDNKSTNNLGHLINFDWIGSVIVR